LIATSDAKVGWTVGAGVEYALTNNWTLKAESIYMDFGSIGATGNEVFSGTPFNHSTDFKVSTARVGIN
jgi:outer membrane immunogenic protein